ncbi:MAG: AI-2E family transporter [Actinomycetota bacterium]|nr:AI-2E family transporter [Actinomycetota bacterium]
MNRRSVTEHGHDDQMGVLADPVPLDASTGDETPEAHGTSRTGSTALAVAGADVVAPRPETVVAVRPVAVPRGVDIAAAWSWRLLLLAAAACGVYVLIGYLSPVVVPLVIALLVTALAVPAVDLLDRVGLPRGLSAAVVVLVGLAAVGGLLTVVGTQIGQQFNDLRVSVNEGLGQAQDWLREGPLQLSQAQLDTGIGQLQDAIARPDANVADQVASVGTTVGHAFAGFFITLFATIFLLYDGERIWRWTVRLFPRDAREPVDSSGRVAWVSLTAFVRATIIVALVDAIGIAFSAWVLDVPLVLAIGVLVFLGAFVPVVGAFVSGGVACLVALVDQGPITALIMFGAVVLVQQIESHLLQPFLMGRFVSLHPLAVILAIAIGVLVAGIVGALVAVPLAACANAVVQHLATRGAEGAPRALPPVPT